MFATRWTMHLGRFLCLEYVAPCKITAGLVAAFFRFATAPYAASPTSFPTTHASGSAESKLIQHVVIPTLEIILPRAYPCRSTLLPFRAVISIMIPMDTVKTRLVTQTAQAGVVPYKGVLRTLTRIVKEEGVGPIYRSLTPRLVSVVPMIGIQVRGVGAIQKKAGPSCCFPRWHPVCARSYPCLLISRNVAYWYIPERTLGPHGCWKNICKQTPNYVAMFRKVSRTLFSYVASLRNASRLSSFLGVLCTSPLG